MLAVPRSRGHDDIRIRTFGMLAENILLFNGGQ